MRKMMYTLLLAATLAGCGGGSDSVPQAGADDLVRPLSQSLQAQPQALAAADSGTSMLRVYQAFYGGAPGYNEYTYRSNLATASSLGAQYASDFSGMSDDALASQVLANVGISLQSVNSSAYTALQYALAQMFAAYGRNARGQIVANLVGLLADLESNATFGTAARSFNAQVSSNAGYSSSPVNTASTRRTTGTPATSASSYQAAYNACYVGTPALYSSTYCQAYANAVVAGAGAAAANQAGADAARSNVGNIGMGGTVSSVGTPNPNVSSASSGSSSTGSSTPSYSSAYAECYNGTPALYSLSYCSAYATARASGQSAEAANLAGATAANSNVGNVGTGQPISSVGSPRGGSTGTGSSSSASTGGSSPPAPGTAIPSSVRNSSAYTDAYTLCYFGSVAAYANLVYCQRYSFYVATGYSSAQANWWASEESAQLLGNVGMNTPLDHTGVPRGSVSYAAWMQIGDANNVTNRVTTGGGVSSGSSSSGSTAGSGTAGGNTASGCAGSSGATQWPSGYLVRNCLVWMPVLRKGTWSQANSFCRGTIANVGGWRQPTYTELRELYLSNRSESAWITLAEQTLHWARMGDTWSSSVGDYNGSHTIVSLGTLYTEDQYDSADNYISCVHTP